MRQLPEYCAECKRQIATLETCVLPDGTRKRGVEVTFKESARGGIRCVGCAEGEYGSSWRSAEELRAMLGKDAPLVLDGYDNPLKDYTRRGKN